MDTTPCQLDRAHTGVWACDCAHSGVFCSVCVLDHMGSATQPHSVRPLGPTGQHVCGKCHGQPVESIRFKYDICLCPTCAGNLTVSSVSGQRLAPSVLGEAEIKQRGAEHEAKQYADLPAEESQKRRGEAPRTMLQRLIADKRNDIQQSLRRAYDNMNSLEEIIQEALNLEAQLTASRAEVQSLQKRLAEESGGQVGSTVGLKEFVERIEFVSRESADLRNLNNALTAEVAGLKAKLQAAEELTALKEKPSVDNARMKEVLKNQLDEAVAMLQESLFEQTQESAKIAAQKVTDVMPLVANLDLDNDWLDRESLEKLLHIASLAIEGFVDPKSMREVSKVCVGVAKLLPRNRLTAVFIDTVGKRLKTKREEGLKLVRCVQAVYEKILESGRAKEVMEGLLRVLEKDAAAFENSMSIISHLAKLLDLQELCEVMTSTTATFEQQRPDNEDRKEFLLSLPVDWSVQRDAAKQCVMELIRPSQKGNFDRSFLLLARLLNSGRTSDPVTLFALTTKLAKLIPNVQLQDLIAQLASFLEVASKSPNSVVRIEVGLATLKHLLKEEDAAQEIQLLAVLIDALKTKDALIGLLSSLTKNLKEISAKTASTLGFAALNWTLPNRQIRTNVNFLVWLLEALAQSDRKDIEETAKIVAALLSAMSQAQAEELEFAMQALVNKNFSLQKVCSLASIVLASFDAEQMKYVSQQLAQLANNSTQAIVLEWIERMNELCRANKDLIYKTYKTYGELVRRNVRQVDASVLGKEFLTIIKEGTDSASLQKMLDAILNLLQSDKIQHAHVTRICNFWSLTRRLLPTDKRIYQLCSHFLVKVPNFAEFAAVIDSLEQTLNVGDGIFKKTVFQLAELYMESIEESSVVTRRFTNSTLESLRRMQTLGEASKTSLEALIKKTKYKLHGEFKDARLRYLEGVFHLCQLRKQEIETLLAMFSQVLDQQSNLDLIKLMQPINLERYIDLLALARPDANITNALSKLAQVTVFLESRGIDVPKTTQEVSAALLTRSTELADLLDSIIVFINKNNYVDHFQLAYRLLQELSVRNKESLPLLKHFSETAMVLLEANVAPAVVLKFCDVALGGLNDAGSKAMLERLRAEGANAMQELVAMLNREKEAVTLKAIEEIVPPPPQQLAHVKAGAIRFFNFQNRAWDAAVPLNAQIHANDNSRWTFLDGNRVFCCGGSGTYKEAYILTRGYPNWTVTQQPNMMTARFAHGIIYLAEFDTVFVFGEGYNTAVKQCEKFDLKQPQAWKALPDMQQARGYFNPVYYRDVIYLCGNNSTIMEAFSPRTNVFVPLNITVPESHFSCLYVDDDKLVVHSRQYILKYNLNPANQLTEVSRVQTPAIDKRQNSQPVLDKAKRLVFMSYCGNCVVFNMDTGAQA